jgi:hypothetical protein
MKKSYKYIVVVVAAIAVFGLGSLVRVSADGESWKNLVVNDAQEQIAGTANSETSALLSDIDGAQLQIN